MQINLGERIKELRKRDCRTQEALATAVGVTNQAVSRWESGGAYPDIELIPAIAHYFHVSIDELFGYSEEREETVNRIISEAYKALQAGGDQTQTVEMLRTAAEEFPSEVQIVICLGYAFEQQGMPLFRRCLEKGDYLCEDYECNRENPYWQEAIRVYEKALRMGIPSDEPAIKRLAELYYRCGYIEKAKALAEKQNPVYNSREMLLCQSTEMEERDRYAGEAIIALLKEFDRVLNIASDKKSYVWSEERQKVLENFAHLIESIFSDGNCGVMHFYLFTIYESLATLEKDPEKALEHFDVCFEHFNKYQAVRQAGENHYTAPLVSKVTDSGGNYPTVDSNFLKEMLISYPKSLQNAIRENQKYAQLFEE